MSRDIRGRRLWESVQNFLPRIGAERRVGQAEAQATVAEVGFDSLEWLLKRLSALAELTTDSRRNYGRFGSASAA